MRIKPIRIKTKKNKFKGGSPKKNRWTFSAKQQIKDRRWIRGLSDDYK